jgi:hypothetical protein
MIYNDIMTLDPYQQAASGVADPGRRRRLESAALERSQPKGGRKTKNPTGR